jgi:hypothetical protein
MHEDLSESGCMAAPFLTSIRWRRVVIFTSLPLYLRGKNPRYLLDRWLGGLGSRYGCSGDGKNLTLAGNRSLAVQPVVHRYTD